jgi:signal peptidase
VKAAVNISGRFVETIEELLDRGHAVRFAATGWSMHPTIRNGETITVVPLADSVIRKGDILLYRHGRGALAHRVIRMHPSSGQSLKLTLRGDAADCSDEPIRFEQLLGRVLSVERNGRTVRFGLLSATWSRAMGRALRSVRVARTQLARAIRSGA